MAVMINRYIQPWHGRLVKPRFQPPTWLFAPVWICLYTAIGIASYFVWVAGDSTDIMYVLAITLYVVQLLLNYLWTLIFFWRHDLKSVNYYIGICRNILCTHSNIFSAPSQSWITMIVLLLTVVCCSGFFAHFNVGTLAIMIPYILWLCYAFYLNYNIYLLNGSGKEASAAINGRF